MRFLKYSLFLCISCLLIFAACTHYIAGTQSRNLAPLYQPTATTLFPEYKIYHIDDSVSYVYFKLRKDDLSFKTIDSSGIQKAKIRFQYFVYDENSQSHLLDSNSFILNFQRNKFAREFVSYFQISAKQGKNYLLEIVATDLHQNKWHNYFHLIQKKDKQNRENFLLSSNIDNSLIFSPILKKDSWFSVSTNRADTQEVYISYYSDFDAIPAPPFSVSKNKYWESAPDSSWILAFHQNKSFKLKYRGMYHFRTDSTTYEGFTLFCFDEFFPEFKTAQQLIDGLQYLTSSKEYFRMLETENMKLALDSFWLKISGNTTRAKQLISVFYTRGKLANRYFSSLVEGWQTDRGMIYMMFGEPKIVYRNSEGERWIYSESTNSMSLDFFFYKIDNPFSDNLYVLNRNQIYKTSWFQAVDTWRNGRVYSLGN